jgi:actin cytoskeleton-regulatory complex protein SLA1
LHKLNGVKIAVVVAKMAVEDLEFVEGVTGVSLDDEKPLSDIRRRSLQAVKNDDRKKAQSASTSKAEDSAEGPKLPGPKDSAYDWFEFFLKAGVSPYLCERYAFNFYSDSMDEAILPDITPSVLRTLGLKEGDVLRVTKYLDTMYNRGGPKSKLINVSFGGEELISPDDEGNQIASLNGAGGGLFSGPGGALRNNTRKGRPAPPVQTEDFVDAEAFRQRGTAEKTERSSSEAPVLASLGKGEKHASAGFDDDAWDVKPSKKPNVTQPTSDPSASTKAAPLQPPLVGAFADMSLLLEPLQPTIVHNAGGQESQQPRSQVPPQPTPQPQISGPSQSFLSQVGQQSTNTESWQQSSTHCLPPSSNNQQILQLQQTPQQSAAQRQRPQAPPAVHSASFILPPPPRPLSAPQNTSQNHNFGPSPLQPQLTGVQDQLNLQNRMAPHGQSLNALEQVRLQQLYGLQQNYPQATGFGQQSPGYGQYGPPVPQAGIGQQFQLAPQVPVFQSAPQFADAQQTGSPFADPRQQQQISGFQPLIPQMTGYLPQPQSSIQAQSMGSINSYLPPALQPQTAGANGLGRGVNGYTNQAGFGQSQPPPPPPIPSSLQPPLAPLQPQKTGPAPPIRFGVGEAKKLVPQATGRRANLSQASKCDWSRCLFQSGNVNISQHLRILLDSPKSLLWASVAPAVHLF